MSIYINKDTLVMTQGITGKTGQFHTRGCVAYANASGFGFVNEVLAKIYFARLFRIAAKSGEGGQGFFAAFAGNLIGRRDDASTAGAAGSKYNFSQFHPRPGVFGKGSAAANHDVWPESIHRHGGSTV
jgi:hypothetical protein